MSVCSPLTSSKQSGGWIDRSAGTAIKFTIGGTTGKRVQEIRVNGEPIDPKRMYSIAACARAGDPPDAICQISKIEEPKTLEATGHEVLRAYFAKHTPVRLAIEQRIVATDHAGRLWSQASVKPAS